MTSLRKTVRKKANGIRRRGGKSRGLEPSIKDWLGTTTTVHSRGHNGGRSYVVSQVSLCGIAAFFFI